MLASWLARQLPAAGVASGFLDSVLAAGLASGLLSPAAAGLSPAGGGVLAQVRVPNRFKLDWIRSQYAHRIESILAELAGVPVRLELLDDDTTLTEERIDAAVTAAVARVLGVVAATLVGYFLVPIEGGNAAVAGSLGAVAGIALVLQPKLSSAGDLAPVLVPLGVNVVGMIAVTLGTFYQKRFIASGDLRTVYFYPDQLQGHIERVYKPGE